MATVIVFTENNVRILQNPDDLSQYRNRPDCVIDPDLSEVTGTPPHLWKLLDGRVVRMQKYEESKRINHIETFGAINTIQPVKLSKIKKIKCVILHIFSTINYVILRIKDIILGVLKSLMDTVKAISGVLAKLPLKTLDFCNLLDYNKRLSITNIALIALLVKMVVAKNIDWPSLVAVVVAFSNYAHKRVVSSNAENE